MPRKEITLYDCEFCHKTLSLQNKARHTKICKPKFLTDDDREIIIEKKKRLSKGQNFFLTFNKRFVKYRLCKRILYNTDIEAYVVSNETGSGFLPFPHSHAVIKTRNKMNFVEFKQFWQLYKYPMYQDVQCCRNVKTTIKYVMKEDYRAIMDGFDRDMAPVITKAWICSNKWNKLNYTLYPYSGMGLADKKRFEHYFEQFKNDETEEDMILEFEDAELKHWQRAIVNLLGVQSDRQITWITDRIGNNGKTFLAKYLRATKGAIILEAGKKADIALAYSCEKMVIMDYTRSMKETVNYSILENFKNGFIFSPKYQSGVKIFKPAIVLVLSNWPPEFDKLSIDRWQHFYLENNGLRLQNE